jgi:hypothetical protein
LGAVHSSQSPLRLRNRSHVPSYVTLTILGYYSEVCILRDLSLPKVTNDVTIRGILEGVILCRIHRLFVCFVTILFKLYFRHMFRSTKVIVGQLLRSNSYFVFFLNLLFSLRSSGLCSSGHSSWLQIQRSGFNSWLYQVF